MKSIVENIRQPIIENSSITKIFIFSNFSFKIENFLELNSILSNFVFGDSKNAAWIVSQRKGRLSAALPVGL